VLAHTSAYSPQLSAPGPWVDGIFTQSNFGIITQIGIWLMPEPPGYRPYLITFPEEDDIHPITEITRPLKISMLIPNAATKGDRKRSS
jgi:4-cresol dehydrogenase (hydroxylating)